MLSLHDYTPLKLLYANYIAIRLFCQDVEKNIQRTRSYSERAFHLIIYFLDLIGFVLLLKNTFL